MTEKQYNKVRTYLYEHLLKKNALEIMNNPVQTLVLIKYMEDKEDPQEKKKEILGEAYEFWETLLKQQKDQMKKMDEIRENANSNLKVETEENKMSEEKEVQQQEKGLLDKAKENAPIIIGSAAAGIVIKTVYDSWTKDNSSGSVVTDTVETISAFTDEF
jgi:glutamate/tyrosine decarboxylase-like PLP-dependent enzyme